MRKKYRASIQESQMGSGISSPQPNRASRNNFKN